MSGFALGLSQCVFPYQESGKVGVRVPWIISEGFLAEMAKA